MKSNFEFLKDNWERLYKVSKDAEKKAIPDKRVSYVFARMAVELAVKIIYETDESLKSKKQSYKFLADYLNDRDFIRLMNDGGVKNTLNKIKENGNDAAHWENSLYENSIRNTEYLFKIMKWFLKEYSNKNISLNFNEELLFNENTEKLYTESEIKELENKLEVDNLVEIENYKKKIAKLTDEIIVKENIITTQKVEYDILKKMYEESVIFIETLNKEKEKQIPQKEFDKQFLEIGITEQEGLIWGRIFINIRHSNDDFFAVKYFSPNKEGKATERFLIGKGCFQNSKLFNLFTKTHTGISIEEVQNKKFDNLSLVTKYDKVKFGTASILIEKLLSNIKKQFRFQKGDTEYVSNGHYLIGNIPFMSIWAYKKNYNPISIDSNYQNGSDAISLLQTGCINYYSKPDFGQFTDVRIFPILELEKFYNS